MANTAQFASIPKVGAATIAAANAGRDGSGTIATVFTAGVSGSRIDVINVKAQAATTAGMVRIYLSNGTTHYLIFEVPVTAVTPSASVATFEAAIYCPEGLTIPNGYSLRASTEKAESFNIIARGGDF